MADELILYTNPMSRGRIARWMLEEVGQPYETEVLDYGTTMKAPTYLAINPMGKVPALRHGDAVVTETAAICAYLADAFPQAGPRAAARHTPRAPYYRWLFFAAGPIEAAVDQQGPRRRRAAGARADGGLRQPRAGPGRARRRGVARPHYLVGDSFTAADLYVGAQLGWGMMFGTIEKRPAFEQYWQRLSNRPACLRAKELDDARVAQQKAAG